MRKEVILAVIVGFVLGAIILYGVRLANQSSLSAPNTDLTPTPTQTTTSSSATTSSKINITSPLPNSVFDETQITLTGQTSPQTDLTVVSENDDIIINSDNKGIFSTPLTLSEGENTITVSIPTAQNTIEQTTITVIKTANLSQ